MDYRPYSFAVHPSLFILRLIFVGDVGVAIAVAAVAAKDVAICVRIVVDVNVDKVGPKGIVSVGVEAGTSDDEPPGSERP